MIELMCPRCKHTFFVELYDYGCCSVCGIHYYWDDGWDYENEECINEGFVFDV